MRAHTVKTGDYYTTVNELTDQIPATSPETLKAATELVLGFGPMLGNKLLCEEDKGGILAGIICLRSNLPLAIARWYPYELPDSIKVPIKMEYFRGSMFVNGITKDDKIVIVDDTLSTGGTILALADAVKKVGAEIAEIRVVIEKLGNGGRERIRNELGLEVKSGLGIIIDDNGKIHTKKMNS